MRFLAMAALLLIGVVANGACAQVPQRNILLIIADDYGIDATRFYPKTDRRVTTPPAPATPNLTQLAAGGLLFRNARAQPSCSATRATIMTGRYGFRTGIGKVVQTDPSAPTQVFASCRGHAGRGLQARVRGAAGGCLPSRSDREMASEPWHRRPSAAGLGPFLRPAPQARRARESLPLAEGGERRGIDRHRLRHDGAGRRRAGRDRQGPRRGTQLLDLAGPERAPRTLSAAAAGASRRLQGRAG